MPSTVDGIIANTPKIHNLVLAKCTMSKYLHCLHLGHAAAITDGSVILLAKSYPRLRYVGPAVAPHNLQAVVN